MKNGSQLLMESAVDLATKIRNQEPEYSSVAVVKAVIESSPNGLMAPSIALSPKRKFDFFDFILKQ